MLQALKRLKIPEMLLKYITKIYNTPKFKVRVGENESEYYEQKTGIRQGCPLSPYLFILVMSVMMWDIRSRLDTPKQNEPIQGVKFADVLYADDTHLAVKNARYAEKLLHIIEK